MDQRLIRLERFRRKTRESAAKIVAAELRVLIDLAREKTFA